jgi:hypothetical protein
MDLSRSLQVIPGDLNRLFHDGVLAHRLETPSRSPSSSVSEDVGQAQHQRDDHDGGPNPYPALGIEIKPPGP